MASLYKWIFLYLSKKKKKLTGNLILWVAGISLHNFPEGMAVFLGSMKVISDLLHYSGSLEMCYKPFSFTVRIQSLICFSCSTEKSIVLWVFPINKVRTTWLCIAFFHNWQLLDASVQCIALAQGTLVKIILELELVRCLYNPTLSACEKWLSSSLEGIHELILYFSSGFKF